MATLLRVRIVLINFGVASDRIARQIWLDMRPSKYFYILNSFVRGQLKMDVSSMNPDGRVITASVSIIILRITLIVQTLRASPQLKYRRRIITSFFDKVSGNIVFVYQLNSKLHPPLSVNMPLLAIKIVRRYITTITCIIYNPKRIVDRFIKRHIDCSPLVAVMIIKPASI